MKIPKMCPCGQPIHFKAGQSLLYNTMRKEWGEYKRVKILGGKMYQVPLYFFILHSQEINNMDFTKLGFEEIES